MKYQIKMKYIASYTTEVEADNEGDALGKCRDLAEDADMSEYIIEEEMESQILQQGY